MEALGPESKLSDVLNRCVSAVVCMGVELLWQGYPAAKTVYGDQELRCPVFLVETAHKKQPAQGTLGGRVGILLPGSKGDGHIPRNIRLSLMLIDFAEPYLELEELQYTQGAAVEVVAVEASWRVGGAVTVDNTYLEWARSATDAVWNKDETAFANERAGPVLPCQGFSAKECVRWGGKQYKVQLELDRSQLANEVCVRAQATVDTSWGLDQPESHIARLRTDSSWETPAARSRKLWSSAVRCIAVLHLCLQVR